MAAATEKATTCCIEDAKPAPVRKASNVLQDWSVAGSAPSEDQISKRATVATLIRSVDSLPQPAANPTATKGIYEYFCFQSWFWMKIVFVLCLVAEETGSKEWTTKLCCVLSFFLLLVSKTIDETELHQTI